MQLAENNSAVNSENYLSEVYSYDGYLAYCINCGPPLQTAQLFITIFV